MEKSMMVGDFLFVSKIQYGSRLPMTPLAVPLVHNKIPLLNAPSYSDLIKLPYLRLPKITDVERLDPVVFNYPMESEKPIDKREHYVKRCLAIPGDELTIVDGQVFINGDSLFLPDRALPQFNYYVKTLDNNYQLSPKYLKEEFDINYVPYREWSDPSYPEGDVQELISNGTHLGYLVTIPSHKLEEFRAMPNVVEVSRVNSEANKNEYPPNISKWLLRLSNQHSPGNQIFPNPAHGDITFNWTRDNYGPIYMPQEGDKLELTKENFLKFRRIIEVYEGNELKVEDGKYIINGEVATHYTFKQGYYWMMGDNRHNSLDSRYWGYVPEDHIVGKPVFIWMSFDKFASGFSKIRTNRVFTTVNGAGNRFSYFWPFVIVVVVISSLNNVRKKRKKKKQDA
jgi:signal peptidase I